MQFGLTFWKLDKNSTDL